MHYAVKFVPYAIAFCISLVAVDWVFKFIKVNFPQAVTWTSTAPTNNLSYEGLFTMKGFEEMLGDSVDSLVSDASLVHLQAKEPLANSTLFYAVRSTTCPAARCYARALQNLASSMPDVEFVAVVTSPEQLDAFKEKSWTSGRIIVDRNLAFWNFIWYLFINHRHFSFVFSLF